MKRIRILLWLAAPTAAAMVLGCRMNRPPVLGPVAGKLLPCPGSPNCVGSQDPDADHWIAPLPVRGTVHEAMTRLKVAVLAEPRTRATEEREGYLRVESTSLLFRFVDDVEFLHDGPAQVIHVRSASRVGHSDLGVNRRRIETLRAALAR
jgi:uncharacterized protein (DUF1499 family)